MYKNKEEIAERIRAISADLEAKLRKSEESKLSAFTDKGRIEELNNLYNMFVEEEGENDEA